jgi:hypothetical protein
VLLASGGRRRRLQFPAPLSRCIAASSGPGLGITELGLIGILAGGTGHTASAQVTAAVLMYRAVTYLPSIPLGALACLTWRYAPALISTARRQRSPHTTR